MKAKLQNTTQGFKPVEIALTFETQEELDTFYELMGCNVSVPDFVGKQSFAFNEELCTQIMDNIWETLDEVITKEEIID